MLPSPYECLANCLWLPRILAKARLHANGQLPSDYASRFCHPGGVDGHFLAAFNMDRGELLALSTKSDQEAATAFLARPDSSPTAIERWNDTALNLGRPGYPLAERFPIALRAVYKNVAHLNPATVFETLVADEAN